MRFQTSFLTPRIQAAPLVRPALQPRRITPEKPGAGRFAPAVARFQA